MPDDVASEAVEDTSLTDPAPSADTPDAGAPADGAEDSVNDAPAGADATKPAAPDDSSLTSPDIRGQQPPPAEKPAAQAVDWQKRYAEVQSDRDRRLAEAKRQLQAQEAEFNRLREAERQRQEQAKLANLPRWSKQHPDYAKFEPKLALARSISAQLRNAEAQFAQATQGMTPEQVEVARRVHEVNKAAITGALPEEDWQAVQAMQQEQQQLLQNFATDMPGTLWQVAQPLVRQEIQAFMQQMRAEQQVAEQFNDPELRPLIEAHKEELNVAMNRDGVPHDYALHMMRQHETIKRMKAEAAAREEELSKEIEELRKTAVHGSEQSRLAKGKAGNVTRPGAKASPIQDNYAKAKALAAERGISTADPRFMDILREISPST